MVNKKAGARMQTQIFAAASALVFMVAIGTIVYHHIEDWSWASSFYFTVISLTTVGYGDLAPTTDAARVFTAFFILVGSTIVVASVGVIGSTYLEKRGIRVEKRKALHEK